MWGAGGWGPPMWGWGFGWIFPLIGVTIALVFVIAMVRAMSGGGRFMCMGGKPSDTDELRREVRELREEVNRLKSVR